MLFENYECDCWQQNTEMYHSMDLHYGSQDLCQLSIVAMPYLYGILCRFYTLSHRIGWANCMTKQIRGFIRGRFACVYLCYKLHVSSQPSTIEWFIPLFYFPFILRHLLSFYYYFAVISAAETQLQRCWNQFKTLFRAHINRRWFRCD